MFKKILYILLGIILFSSGVYYALNSEAADYIIMSILIASGIGFLFFPTKIITLLQTFIKKKSKE